MPTALITHRDCLRHEISADHPECPHRLDVINDQLMKQDVFDYLVHRDAPLAEFDHLVLAHPESYIEMIHTMAPQTGTVALDGDTSMNPHSLNAGLRSAGAGVKAVDMVCSEEANNAFCLTRPPGHHAERSAAMGFCLFGNAAIAARHAISAYGLERVAILDFDVHHGNGTEDIVDGDSRILFCSSFQYPFYPGHYRDNVLGQRVNVPLPSGTASAGFRQAITSTWWPALDQFKPQLLILSAGFDAHSEDVMSNIALVDDDFAWITHQIMEIADRHASGRIVSILEGGYALPALSRCATLHIRGLMQL